MMHVFTMSDRRTLGTAAEILRRGGPTDHVGVTAVGAIFDATGQVPQAGRLIEKISERLVRHHAFRRNSVSDWNRSWGSSPEEAIDLLTSIAEGKIE